MRNRQSLTHDAVSAGRADRTLHIDDGVLQ